MKKKLALLFAILMLAVLFAGCKSGTETSPQETQQSLQETQQSPQESQQETPQETQQSFTNMDASTLPTFDAFPRPKMGVDGKLKVGYLYGALDQDDKMRLFRQMDIECYVRGWDLQTIDTSGSGSASEEQFRTGFLTAVNMGVDLIVIPGVNDMENKRDLIEQARNAGIAVYTEDCQSIAGVIANFGPAWGVGGMELFYRVASDVDYTANVTIHTAFAYAAVWERSLGWEAYLENDAIFPNMNLLDVQQTDFTSPIALPMQGYNYMQAWNQKYGKDMNVVFIPADNDANGHYEAAVAAGRTGDDLTIATMGGGARVVTLMREPNSMVKYEYGMSWEMAIHNICELATQIQLEGLTPGDGKCMINVSGGVSYIPGGIITRDNLPKAGSSIHSIMDYYDENNKDAWYFWTSPTYEVYTWDD